MEKKRPDTYSKSWDGPCRWVGERGGGGGGFIVVIVVANIVAMTNDDGKRGNSEDPHPHPL
jgi:hypothetical protein